MGGRGLHFGVILGVWAGSGSQMRLGRRLGRLLGDFQSQDGSNLGPKKVPSWSRNGVKIDEKIAQKFDGFGNLFLKGFWWILERILAPKSRPKSMLSSKGVFLKKHCFSLGKIHFFDIHGVQVGSKKRSKIDENRVSEASCFRIGFYIIF